MPLSPATKFLAESMVDWTLKQASNSERLYRPLYLGQSVLCILVGVLSVMLAAGADAQHAKNHPTETQDIYIVQLRLPSLSIFLSGLEAAKDEATPAGRRSRPDFDSPAAREYLGELLEQQAIFLRNCTALLHRDVQAISTQQHAINSVVLALSPAEASSVATLAEVKLIEKEREIPLLTDAAPKMIGAPEFWALGNLVADPMYQGEGVVIAIIDSGINYDHPSFSDTGGSDSYDHTNPLGTGNYLPNSYCDVTDSSFCNDKLIGVWDFTNVYPSPDDDLGHGTHVAATAAGNRLQGAQLGAFSADVSGVAPHANIIAYDACYTRCSTLGLTGAINQVIADAAALPNGIHAINLSTGNGVVNPYSDTVQIALRGAVAAGIYVAASAGNGGSSSISNLSPWVASTAATEHGRRLVSSLKDLESDGESLEPLSIPGITGSVQHAPIVLARDHPVPGGQDASRPAFCLDEFPAHQFSGQIVVCEYVYHEVNPHTLAARVQAGGAGGILVVNSSPLDMEVSNGLFPIPGLHLDGRNGRRLLNWLNKEGNDNPHGTITATRPQLKQRYTRTPRSTSSHGPNPLIDVLKPDLAAPGTNVFAAWSSHQNVVPEFMLASGTSMASPQHAAAAALIAKITDWTPTEIRSALMMTAKKSKPLNQTQLGAGRLDLRHALATGLVLHESIANMTAADPSSAGDPSTLNLASMQKSACGASCSWTRTFRSVADDEVTWRARVPNTPDGVIFKVTPRRFVLQNDDTINVTVTANVPATHHGWAHSYLHLRPVSSDLPKLHLPIAVKK